MSTEDRRCSRDEKAWAENYEAIDWGDRDKRGVKQPKPNRCDATSKFGKVTHAPFPHHYSYVHGKKLTSWSEYHQANKDGGIIDCGEKPERPKDTTVPYSSKVGTHVN